MITVNAVFGQEEKALGMLGRVGEKETRQIVFDCTDILSEYPGAEIVCVMQRHCDRTAYLADAVLAGNVLTVTLTDADVSASGDLRIELRALVDGKIRKSAVYTGKVVSALRGEQDKPGNPTADVLNRIDMTISRAEESIAEANAAAQSAREVADTVQAKLDNGDFVGSAGKDGKDGEKGPKGDTGATGPQGAPGSDASVTADNIQAALGYTPVKDVQVAGSSVMADGVASVPNVLCLKDDGSLRVVNPPPNTAWTGLIGILPGTGSITLATSTAATINLRGSQFIGGNILDYATKAAMCDGKGAAWTETEQKAARERIGADGNYVLIEETVLTEETLLFERIQEPDGTPYNFSAISLIVKFVPGQTNGAFFCFGKNNGIRIIGGESKTLSMPSLSGNANFRSVAVFKARPGYGCFYDCDVAVGSQGSAMEITRSAGGAYTMAETSKKIKSIAFYLYYNTNIKVIAGTEIAIYGVRT